MEKIKVSTIRTLWNINKGCIIVTVQEGDREFERPHYFELPPVDSDNVYTIATKEIEKESQIAIKGAVAAFASLKSRNVTLPLEIAEVKEEEVKEEEVKEEVKEVEEEVKPTTKKKKEKATPAKKKKTQVIYEKEGNKEIQAAFQALILEILEVETPKDLPQGIKKAVPAIMKRIKGTVVLEDGEVNSETRAVFEEELEACKESGD